MIRQSRVTYLVWIFHDQVFAFLEFQTDVNNTPQYTPSVVHVQVNLVGKLCGLKLLSTKDYMVGSVLLVVTRYISE